MLIILQALVPVPVGKRRIGHASGLYLLHSYVLTIDCFFLSSVKELQSLAGGQLSSLSDTQDGEDPFLFILALQVPGTPMVYAVLYWAIDPELLSGDSIDPAVRLLQTYVDLPIKEKPYIAKKVRGERKTLVYISLTYSSMF